MNYKKQIEHAHAKYWQNLADIGEEIRKKHVIPICDTHNLTIGTYNGDLVIIDNKNPAAYKGIEPENYRKYKGLSQLIKILETEIPDTRGEIIAAVIETYHGKTIKEPTKLKP